MNSATILLSRQPLRPSGRSEWVIQVQRAVRWCRANGHRLLTSYGLQTWEMVTAVGAMEKIPMRLYLLPDRNSPAEGASRLREQLDLELILTEFVESVADTDTAADENALLARDARIVRDADIIIPISIRRNGAMARLLEAARLEGKRIIEEFQCPYRDRTAPIAYTVGAEDLNPELSALGERFVFHWTRGTNNAWPGERFIDFYRDIIASEFYPKSAFDTLCRIVRDRLLIASSRHMPGRIPTVSFTGLAPEKTAPLMRWRARYSEMSFEPYGIGIDRQVSERVGIRPVRYYDGSESASSPKADQWLTQSIGAVTDWRQEKEYRHRGDLSLAEFSSDELVVATRTHQEAQEIESRFQIRAMPFCRL